jgi:hypothetical protein
VVQLTDDVLDLLEWYADPKKRKKSSAVEKSAFLRKQYQVRTLVYLRQHTSCCGLDSTWPQLCHHDDDNVAGMRARPMCQLHSLGFMHRCLPYLRLGPHDKIHEQYT